MFEGMEQRIFRLARAGGIDTNIQHLEPYHVAVRPEVDQRRQSAIIVKLPNFEADISTYAAAQGYTHEPAGAFPW